MPVSFNSPARNLFLLGASGVQTVTNFFKTIDRSSDVDGAFIPDDIRFNEVDQQYVLAGTGSDSNSATFGWVEKRNYDGETGGSTETWRNKVQSTSGGDVTLRAMELDSNNNLIVVGRTDTVPWIAKYSNAGVLDWQTSTATANTTYLGVTSDANGNYYACGRTSLLLPDTQAFVEQFDANGNPGWGKQAYMLGRDVVLKKISANNRGEVVAVGYLEDDSANKGYIVKIDTSTGDVLWDRTLERNLSGIGLGNPSSGGTDDVTPADVACTACYIDSKDQIYVVGYIDGNEPVNNGVGGFIIKYSPEGNIIWQRESNTTEFTNSDGFPNEIPFDVKSDGETQQTAVLSVEDFGPFALNNSNIYLTKYSKNGDLVFRRTISKGSNNLGAASLDADPSFYYILFRDQQVDVGAGEPDRYTFGKVSTSGNGLGDFFYNTGVAPDIDYTIYPNAENKIGRLSDGSVTNSVSDLITYPFTANKLVFDDLATHVSNKKRQMDDADSFEYSGSPAIRPADFQELNLLGDTGFVDETTGSATTLGAQTWSNDLTTANPNNGFRSTTPATLAFDGGTDTAAGTDSTSTGNQIVWSPSQFPAANGPYTLEILSKGDIANGGWTGRLLKINGTTYFDPAVDTLPTDYITVSNLTEITEVIVEGAGNSARARIDTVKVNGTELIDGQGITLGVPTTTKVKDQSGKGNDGVVNGATHNAAGYWELDGVDDYISLGIQDFIDVDFSLEAWVYITSAKEHYFFSLGYNDTNSALFYADASTQELKAILRSGGVNSSISSFEDLATNQWYHILWTRDGATNKIYLDGVEVGSSTNETTSSLPACIYDIGWATTRDNATAYLQGRMGEVRIYDRAITSTAVFQNYNATKSKYINEAPDTAPKIASGIAIDNNLKLNYDFSNKACYNTYQVKANLASLTTSITDTRKLLTPISRPDNPNQSFGNKIAIGSGKIVVACSGFGDVIYVYDLLGQNETIIENPEAGNITEFASNIVINNNRLYVGATQHGTGGLVYIYDLNTRTLLQTVTPSGIEADDNYGGTLSVGDGKLVVGAQKYGTQQTFTMQLNGIPGTEYGAAFVYDLDATGLVIDNTEKILRHSDPLISGSNISGSITSGDLFGSSVAVGEGKIAVGAKNWGNNGHGAVYVYDLDGTNEVKLAPETGTDDFFGAIVRIGEGKLVVGVPLNNNFEFNLFETGSIYIYDLDDLSQFVHLYPSDVENRENKKFGSSIAIGDGKIAVGMFPGLSGPSNPRAMYLYDLDGTNEIFFGEDIGGLSVAIGEGIIATGTSYGSSAYGDTADWIQGYVNLYSMLTPLPTTVKNLTGPENTSILDNVTYEEGCMVFNGSSSVIDVPNVLTGFTDEFTLEVWVNTSNFTPNDGDTSAKVIGLNDNGLDGDIAIFNSGRARFRGGGASGIPNEAVTDPDPMNLNQWYHLVCTYSNGRLVTGYRDGSSVGTYDHDPEENPAPALAANQPVQIGRYQGVDSFAYTGKIGEVRVYNRALSATEVLQNFNSTRGKYGV